MSSRSPRQTGWCSRPAPNYVETSKNIAAVVVEAVNAGTDRAEATVVAEEEWVAMHLEQGQPFGSAECTPGGATGYFKLVNKWRDAGDFAGLTFGTAASTSS